MISCHLKEAVRGSLARHSMSVNKLFEPQDVAGDRCDLITSFVGRYFIRVSETLINCETGVVGMIYRSLITGRQYTSVPFAKLAPYVFLKKEMTNAV